MYFILYRPKKAWSRVWKPCGTSWGKVIQFYANYDEALKRTLRWKAYFYEYKIVSVDEHNVTDKIKETLSTIFGGGGVATPTPSAPPHEVNDYDDLSKR